MATASDEIEKLRDLMRQADLATLLNLDREIHLLLEQKRHEARSRFAAARDELAQRYPHLNIDAELIALVGVHTENPVEDNTVLIAEQVTRSLSA